MTGPCFSSGCFFFIVLSLFSAALTAGFHVNVRITYSLTLLYCKAYFYKSFLWLFMLLLLQHLCQLIQMVTYNFSQNMLDFYCVY